ncbi:MAG: chromosome segregation DNA-binding protein, partial [Acidimicrobiaceae bacterium]|nr:chromosome segregation DNA-binding protein [Acidimicrobiaceae bacterium]
MPRRSGLGRGLGALIPTEVSNPNNSSLREIPLSGVRPNQFQPRTQFAEEALASLVDSIRAVGVLQPVLVREVGEGEYELIAGERRCRAARRAGLQTIPALVQTASDVSSLEQALVENIQREQLNPLDEAAAYQQLIEDFSMTHEEVAGRVGRSRAAISNALRLFQLPPTVQRLVRDERLSAGHARALLGTPDRELQERLAAEAVSSGLSVRTLEEQVRRQVRGPEEEPERFETVAEDQVVERPVAYAGNATNGAPQAPLVTTAAPALRPPGVLEL